MAKKRRAPRPSLGEQLSSCAKRGLVFIVLIALALLIILAAFQSAGDVGAYIDHLMALGFGWTRLVAALALIILAFSVVMPHSQRITPWTHIGTILLFLSVTGFIDLLALKNQPITHT